jgi:signal transduction histidine kinase
MPEDVAWRGHIPRKGSIAEWVVENDKPLLLNDDVSDSRFSSISEKPLRSSICCPLRAHGKVIGALNVTRTQGVHFADEDLEALVIMATQAAVSIENARLLEENVRGARMAAIGQTVSGISHCVKNMLTSLNGGMALGEMAIEQKNWEVLDSGWKMLRRSVNRISLLVLDMLDYGKERQPLRAPVLAARLLDEVAATVEYEAHQKGVAVAVEIDRRMPEIDVDKNQIFRCLLNLATNAVDAVEHGQGQITLRAELIEAEPAQMAGESVVDSGGSVDDPSTKSTPSTSSSPQAATTAVVFSVQDNGCGIEPEQIQNIFQPFYSTKGSKGTGIGLAVTRKIVLEHDGRVEVDSRPGHGTTFRLIIPCLSGSSPKP